MSGGRPGEAAAVEAALVAERARTSAVSVSITEDMIAAAYPVIAEAVRAEEREQTVARVRLDEFEDWTVLAELFGAKLVTEGFPSGEYVTNMVWPDGRYAYEADTLAILRSDGSS